MLHVICTEAAALGISDRVHIVHAVLKKEGWPGTLEIVEKQADHYRVPVHYMERPQGSLLEHVRQRQMWPSSRARYCTSDHKRAQISKIITKLVNTHPNPRPRVLNCIGIRAAESRDRAKKQPFISDIRQTNRKRVVDIWYPIFDWSVERVWETVRIADTPVHPAYSWGMPRLSCCFCIFAPKSALILAGKHNLSLLKEYVAVEKEIGHKFRPDLAIANVLTVVERKEEPGKLL